MNEVHDRLVLMVTLGLLVLSFFSYTVQFGTGQATAAGENHFTCWDVKQVEHLQPEDYQRRYDLNRNGRIDGEDLKFIREAAKNTRCDEH